MKPRAPSLGTKLRMQSKETEVSGSDGDSDENSESLHPPLTHAASVDQARSPSAKSSTLLSRFSTPIRSGVTRSDSLSSDVSESSRFDLWMDKDSTRVPFEISELDHSDTSLVSRKANTVLMRESFSRAQTRLKWLKHPQKLLIVKRHFDKAAVRDLVTLVTWLIQSEHGSHLKEILIEPAVYVKFQENLRARKSPDLAAGLGTIAELDSGWVSSSTPKPSLTDVSSDPGCSMKGSSSITKESVKKERESIRQFETMLARMSPFNPENPGKDVDLMIVIGGDGTLLYLASLFQDRSEAIPPILCFGRGSLGFLTPFDFDEFPSVMDQVLSVERPLQIDIRMRLHFSVYRRKRLCTEEELELTSSLNPDIRSLSKSTEMKTPPTTSSLKRKSGGRSRGMRAATLGAEHPPIIQRLTTDETIVTQDDFLREYFRDGPHSDDSPDLKFDHVVVQECHALNEILVHRAKASGMLELNLYVDECFLTRVMSDGLIVNTSTGSTAYAVSAGGSLINASVPCIGLVPICPHTLSFRSLVIPDSSLIFITIPDSVRQEPQIGFDGRSPPFQLRKGDIIVIQQGHLPVTTIKARKNQAEWLTNLVEKFNWNVRASQKAVGTADDQTDDASSAGGISSTLHNFDDQLLFGE